MKYSTMTIPVSLFIATLLAPPTSANNRYMDCSRPYKCGNVNYTTLGTFGYPFWGGENHPAFCGDGSPEFEINCIDDNCPVLNVSGDSFRVLGLDQSRSAVSLARFDLYKDTCLHAALVNSTAFVESSTTFRPLNVDTAQNLSIFYRCPADVDLRTPNNFTCNTNGSVSANFFGNSSFVTAFRSSLSRCGMRVDVLLRRPAAEGLYDGSLMLKEAVDQGFDVGYAVPHSAACVACRTSGGICGSNSTKFACLCPNERTALTLVCQSSTSSGSERERVSKTLLGVIAGVIGIGISIVILINCFCRRWIPCQEALTFWKKRSIDQQKIEAFIKNHGPLAQNRYSYAQIKRMTDSFRHKLGEGGYGCVFKGKLHDGELVAVKVLGKSKGNGEEFINEVASISKTCHVNVVTLIGFCFEGSKRALVYEFMPNGSLEKFINNNDNNSKANQRLGCEKLNQIAVGIARGLEYLHRGCKTRILHFDIKPHNILLDEIFCPKISDFGLSKLCLKKESIVSMMEARGTIGYIAPEVFNQNFGGVSYKSDVYSYGMMILEMAGGRRNLDTEVENTSDVYFPQWVYKHFELNEDLDLQRDGTQEDTVIVRKMVIVSLWCIQIDPSLRPSMTEVIDMLEGNLEALKIPPKPFIYSPARPTHGWSSNTATISLQ